MEELGRRIVVERHPGILAIRPTGNIAVSGFIRHAFDDIAGSGDVGHYHIQNVSTRQGYVIDTHLVDEPVEETPHRFRILTDQEGHIVHLDPVEIGIAAVDNAVDVDLGALNGIVGRYDEVPLVETYLTGRVSRLPAAVTACEPEVKTQGAVIDGYSPGIFTLGHDSHPAIRDRPDVDPRRGAHICAEAVERITGDIDLGNACEIIVRDGSSLKLYVDGDIACDNGSTIGTEDASRNAKTLMLYSTGEGLQDFNLKAKNEWVGVIYAPNADVTLYAGGDLYGASIANNFELKSGGDYHYDRALSNVSPDDEGVRFVFTKWNEK